MMSLRIQYASQTQIPSITKIGALTIGDFGAESVWHSFVTESRPPREVRMLLGIMNRAES